MNDAEGVGKVPEGVNLFLLLLAQRINETLKTRAIAGN